MTIYMGGTKVAGSGVSGGTVWGDITGTLASQTDLSTALNGKASSVHTHLWADITDKPTTFTPNLASATVIGGHKVGNGLTMGGGEYLAVRAGNGIKVDAVSTYDVQVDKTVTDTWYAKSTQGLSIWKGTQTEYDAIGAKDANTLYFISGA